MRGSQGKGKRQKNNQNPKVQTPVTHMSTSDAQTSISETLTAEEKGRKKWVILCLGVGVMAGICILLFCKNEEVAEEIRNVFFAMTGGVVGFLAILAGIPKAGAYLQKKKTTVKLALSNWLVFITVCACGFLLPAAAGAEGYIVRSKWESGDAGEAAGETKTETSAGNAGDGAQAAETEAGFDENALGAGCRRNEADFDWRENPTISDVTVYFDGVIADAAECKKELIREELGGIRQTGGYSDEALNSSEYGAYIADAVEWHEQYETSSKGSDEASVKAQEFALQNERAWREDADSCTHTALNLEVLGTVNEALGEYSDQNKNTCLKKALDNYIFALKLSIREQDEALCRDIVDHLAKIYEKLELAGDEDAGEMKEICREMENEIADIICVK